MALDIAKLAVQAVSGAVAGGAQRVGWEASEMTGMFSTFIVGAGGLLVNQMVRDPNLRMAGEAAFISASSTAGWVGTEKMLLGPDGLLGSKLRAGQARRRAKALGGGHALRPPVGSAHNMERAASEIPNASIAGFNPVTGERIRGSAI